MVSWKSYSYVPAVRTRDAELKGIRELGRSARDHLLPLVELTRSRRSKSNPLGAIEISVEKVLEILGPRHFIADLTSMDGQTNPQIETLLDEDNGFKCWTDFVSKHLGSRAIPVAHLTEPFDRKNFRQQVDALLLTQEAFAIRLPTSYRQYPEVFEEISREDSLFGRCVVLADAGFIPSRTLDGAKAAVMRIFQSVSQYSPAMFVPIGSSFPSSVVAAGYGEDAEGEFPLTEIALSEYVKQFAITKNVVHGDYACVHPIDYVGTVTAWVPRVDVPLNESLFYHRYRRPVGGYIAAAQAAIGDPRYVPLECWGHENIVKAAAGSPIGKSPAHWISVRVNYHITRQAAHLL